MITHDNVLTGDLKDSISDLIEDGCDGGLESFAPDAQSAFLLGMYWRKWGFHYPSALKRDIRHLKESLDPVDAEFEFWKGKFAEGKDPDGETNWLEFTNYVLDKMVSITKRQRLLLSFFLGQGLGRITGLWTDWSFEDQLCFVRCSSGPVFIGVVKEHWDTFTGLSEAIELKTEKEMPSVSDVIRSGKPSAAVSTLLVTDTAEITPCSTETLALLRDRAEKET